jgi:hypothetical protein
MSEKKINLEEIWSKYKEFTKGPTLPGMVDLDYFKPIVNIMICEGISQALKLAAETEIEISKQLILDIIKQVE